jgi:phosphoesterase RecJ-like protein
VSVIGSDEQRKETLAALRRAMPFVRHGLGSKIRLRRIPELDVRLDDSIERGTRILKIIDELEAGRNPDEIGGPGESLPTPLPRFPHEGDSLDEMLASASAQAPSPKSRAKRTRSGEHRGGPHKAAHSGKAPAVSEGLLRVDLSDYAAAVPDEVIELLRTARRVLTICHENPEADALGSALAVSLLVEANGGVATPVCADPMPEMYTFLPGMDRFRREPDPAVAYDLLVVGDCGELERIGPVLDTHRGLFERVPILDIDHHISNPRFGAVDWVEAASSATCEMVTLLAWRMEVPLTAADGMLASALAAGIVTDTGNFQHPNVTPRTLVVAAALREAGADFSEIARRLYRSKPNTQLALFGRVLARIESDLDGRLVWSSLELADLTATRALAAESEGLIDLLSQSETSEAAILFKEVDGNGSTRLSIRTRDGGVDATVLAATFGGGGHARAAGATVPLPIAEARKVVLARAATLVAAVRR